MSLPWIKLYFGIMHHPKVDALGCALGVDNAWHHPAAIWLYASQYAKDGDLTGKSDALIAKWAKWPGDPQVFVGAMVEVGFLDRDGDRLVIHGWGEHQGAHIEKAERDRMRAKQRARDVRANLARTSREQSANTARTPREVRADHAGGSRDRGEERRGEREEMRGEERGGEIRPAPAAPEPPPPTPAVEAAEPDAQPSGAERAVLREERDLARMAATPANARRAASEAITGRPQSVDQLLALAGPDGTQLGASWAKRFPALDGQQGRATLQEAIANLWPHSIRQPWGDGRGADSYVAWWATRLAEDHSKARRTYDRDRGTPADEATRSRAPSDPLYPRYQQAREAGQTALGWQEWREAQSKPAAKAPKAAAPGPGKALEHGQDLPDDQLVEVGQLFGSLAAKLGGGR